MQVLRVSTDCFVGFVDVLSRRPDITGSGREKKSLCVLQDARFVARVPRSNPPPPPRVIFVSLKAAAHVEQNSFDFPNISTTKKTHYLIILDNRVDLAYPARLKWKVWTILLCSPSNIPHPLFQNGQATFAPRPCCCWRKDQSASSFVEHVITPLFTEKRAVGNIVLVSQNIDSVAHSHLCCCPGHATTPTDHIYQ